MQEKVLEPPIRREKGGNKSNNPADLCLRNTEACHCIIGIAFLQSVAKIRTHSTMKIKRKMLHEF
jgi:hypothetical protein